MRNPKMSDKDAIREWFKTETHADVLNTAFVEFFVEKTGRTEYVQLIGASKVAGVGRALAELAKAGELERGRIGVRAGPGFPTWVWAYAKPQA